MEEKQIIGVEYMLPTGKQRIKAILVDFLSFLLLTLLLFGLSFSVAYNLPSYKMNLEEMDSVRLESHLYEEDKENKLELVSSLYSTKQGYGEAESKKHMSEALIAFYGPDSPFFSTDKNNQPGGVVFYNSERAKRSDLFEKVSEEVALSSYVEIDSVPDKDFISFYEDAIEKSIGFLSNNKEYVTASNRLLWHALISFFIAYILSFLLLFLMLPMIFYRGYKTLGMMVGKCGRIYVNGLNPTRARFLLYFFFDFLFTGLSVAMLLIPLFISITMLFLSKAQQSLPDYLANTYLIDTSSQDIFLTPTEYALSLKEMKK